MSEEPKVKISGFIPESAMKFFEDDPIPGADVTLTPIPKSDEEDNH